MAAQYKITYFDIRGLAEVPRLVLAAAGVPFTDDRIPFSRKPDGSFERGDWEQRKAQTPYGQVPVLEVDGKVKIAQSAAIVRFLARRHKLAGANEIEEALVDAGFEATLDVRKGFFTARGDDAKVKEFWSKSFPELLAHIEKNVAGNGHFAASNQLTYTDIGLYYTQFVLATENKEAVEAALKANPKIAAIAKNVETNPNVAKYLAARKPTPM